MNYLKRLSLLRPYLLSHQLDGLIVSNRQNICYLTGLTQLHPSNREALLLVTPQKATLYHSIFLSPPRLQNLKTVPMDSSHPPTVIFPKLFSHRVAIESSDYTVAELNKLKSILPQALIVNITDVIETLRLIKDPDEIKLMHRAGQITTQLMSWAQQSLQSSNPPRRQASVLHLQTRHLTNSEIDFSHRLEQKAHELGADGLAFPSVVAFGAHTALPHHQPGKTKLTAGPVLLDIGVQYYGYCSDMTRTFCLGTPPPRFKKIEKIVLSAYQSGLKLLTQHFKIRVLTDILRESRIPNPESLLSPLLRSITPPAQSSVTPVSARSTFIPPATV
jgi:Xaa-Pro aminopeptidase